MSSRSLPLVTCALALGLAACDNTAPPARPDGATEEIDAGAMSTPVTYYDDVRPILVENCTMCHADGGIAPFALETYAQTFEVGDRVAEVTAAGVMPPFLADNSGECQTFTNHRGLTPEEIATIGTWVEMGKLEGDASAPVPDEVVLPSLPSVDISLQMPSEYTVDDTVDDDYRCFVIDTGTTEDLFVTGYDVHPGNPQRVHHVLIYSPTSDAEAARAVTMDEADGVAGDGYPCFGDAGVSAPPLAVWAPGTGATLFPRGTGLPLAAGRPQIIQVHYNNLVPDSPNTDRTSIDLSTTVSAIPGSFQPLAHGGIVLPPRMESVEQSYTVNLDGFPSFQVWGVFPHMHTLGRQLRVDITAGSGADSCLIDVPRWDFNWQLAYWFDSPVRVYPEDAATISCTYNTMSRDETVTWGEGTLDEMCLAFIYATP